MSEVDIIGTEGFTAEDFMQECAVLLYRTLDSMFIIPAFENISTIYEFADVYGQWPTLMPIALTSLGGLIALAAKTIRPTTGVLFEYVEESDSSFGNDDRIDSVYDYETEYSYGSLLVNLYNVGRQLSKYLKQHKEEESEITRLASEITQYLHTLQPNFETSLVVPESITEPNTLMLLMGFAKLVDKFYDVAFGDDEESIN